MTGSPEYPTRRADRTPVLMPDGVELLRLPDSMEILVNWRIAGSRSMLNFMWFFTGFWNLVLIPFVLVAILTGEYEILLYLSLHLAVGLGLIYYMITRMVNHTRVSVDSHGVTVSTAPLPIPFSKSSHIPVSRIAQLYVTDYVAGRVNGEARLAFNLYVIQRGNKEVLLVGGMDKDALLFLEQEIEHYLKIKDMDVKGEITV